MKRGCSTITKGNNYKICGDLVERVNRRNYIKIKAVFIPKVPTWAHMHFSTMFQCLMLKQKDMTACRIGVPYLLSFTSYLLKFLFSPNYIQCQSFCFIIILGVHSLVQPYKEPKHNYYYYSSLSLMAYSCFSGHYGDTVDP